MPESEQPLDELQRKIDQLRPPGDEEKPDGSQTSLGKAMNLGTELLAGTGVGGILGYFIDRALGTLPIFFIVFFFLGFAAGVRNIIRNGSKVE